ncbi:MAG: hypothetical protein WC709_08945 [Thermoleophilia bacterium]
MRPEDGDERPAPTPKRPDHRAEHRGWPAPSKIKGPPPTRSGKTMHHPATRIGEIKHGKA